MARPHVIQSLIWCSHFDSNDALEKPDCRRRIGSSEQVLHIREFCVNCSLTDSCSSVVHKTSLLHSPMTLTHPSNATRAIFPCARAQPDRHQRLILSRSRQRDSLEVLPFLRWNLRLRRVILSGILIPHVVSSCETHLFACTCSTRL